MNEEEASAEQIINEEARRPPPARRDARDLPVPSVRRREGGCASSLLCVLR